MSREMWVSQRRPRLFLPGLKMLRLAAVGSMGVLTPDYRNWGGWGMAAVCNAEREMPVSQSVAEIRSGTGLLVLGVDTCGPSGSVALARLEGASASILGLKELAGRSYSATLVAAVGELLAEHRVKLADVGAIVVVSGPGSFTGVRVGLSAVKGLAEPGQIPVVAVSRLAVLAAKAGVTSAALDAHRHEVFLRLMAPDGSISELLAGADELGSVDIRPAQDRRLR